MKIARWICFSMLFLVFSEVVADKSAEEAFSEIYEHRVWGVGPEGLGSSGGGSILKTTVVYRKFLQNFLSDYNVESVVDLGCGDWEFSRVMNWNGIDYFGYDVVPQLVIKNQNKYGAPNIQFFQGDAIHTDLPPADLLICKDVLQHLPHEDIIALVAQLHKFKYCLITNDIGTNQSTSRGGYRGLDLTLPPFSLKGVKILTYPSEGQLKQVLLITQGEM